MTQAEQNRTGDTPVSRPGPLRRAWPVVATGTGLALVGVAVGGLLANATDTNPRGLAGTLLAGTLAHDLLLAPVVGGFGLLIAVLFPPPYRAILGTAALASAIVTLVTFPLWSGGGRKPDNPSASPLPYGRNLAIVCGAIWALALAGCAAAWIRARARDR